MYGPLLLLGDFSKKRSTVMRGVHTMKYLVMIFSSLLAFNACALSCARQLTEEVISASQDIFVGKVIEIISTEKIETDFPWDAEQRIQAKLRVLDVLRGKQRDTQLVDFSRDVAVGEQYLIFDNSAFSSMCTFSLSTKLEKAGDLLEMIRSQAGSSSESSSVKKE